MSLPILPQSLPRPILAAGLAVATFFCAGSPVTAATDYGEVAHAVAQAMQNQHYSRHDFTDEYSKRMLEHFLDLLDYDHRFFLQSDIDQFRRDYESQLDDMILVNADVSAAKAIYSVFKKRAQDRVAKIQENLEKETFSFDGEDTVHISRKELQWPKDEAEADRLWLGILKNQVLAERLSRQLKAEREAEKAAELTPEQRQEAAEKKAKAEAKPQDTPEKKTAAFWDRFLKSLDENDDEDVINFFLSSLAAAYDPHSEYMSPSENDNFHVGMKNSLVGIGALLSKKDDAVEIQGIVVGGPADKSGLLKERDKIIGVGQGNEGAIEDVRALKLQKIVDQIRGEEGSVVRLRIIPASDPTIEKEISIVRAKVDLKDKVATANLMETTKDGQPLRLGWITLPAFYADMDTHESGCTKDVRRLLERLMKENINGLVLDLRGNGGGSLDEAISMTGLFIKRGPVVQHVDWRRERPDYRSSRNAEPIYNGPLVILTDKTSASASEILAAAIQDYGRGVVVGDESTFGKGTVQTIIDMKRIMPIFSDTSRAGSLKVTIQKFYRIAGGSTQFKGVRSDVVLPQRIDAYEIGEDQLDNPLPYDVIPPLKYSLSEQSPLPLEELRARSQNRVSKEPEFQHVLDDTKRLRDQIEGNTWSLNLKARTAEIAANKERRKARIAERKARVTALGSAHTDDYKVYRLALDTVDEPSLKLESEFSDEQTTGMRLAKDEDDIELADDKAKYPYDLEPVKLESLRILADLIGLTPATRTAQAGASR
ncbi:MAG: carboxy terminal-processing peptidase [Verrucomicrobiales bacterium]